jgi:putative transposase
MDDPFANDARYVTVPLDHRRSAWRGRAPSLTRCGTGATIANPRHYRAAESRLRRAQRRVYRRTKGSKHRAKARTMLAKAHLHVQRQRRDCRHKAASGLVRRFAAIAVEDLTVRGMVRNHPLAKHIGDAGWYSFRQILGDKAASAGRVLVAVNPAGTSQACSSCGARVPKQLSDRWPSWPCCGCALDRDHNAALHSKTRGGTAFGAPIALAAALNREPHTL